MRCNQRVALARCRSTPVGVDLRSSPWNQRGGSMQAMWTQQPEPSDERPEAPDSPKPGTLVVLNSEGVQVAHASPGDWRLDELHGQEVVAIQRLRVSQVVGLALAAGQGLPAIFTGCELLTDSWRRPAVIIGGSWTLWRTGDPLLEHAGFVLGATMNIASAVRALRELLR